MRAATFVSMQKAVQVSLKRATIQLVCGYLSKDGAVISEETTVGEGATSKSLLTT